MFLTIVTINKGGDSGLFRTIASIDRQKFLDFEHIVIEGHKVGEFSYDLESLSNLRRKFVIGLDNSIYDAMNIGLGFSSGKYVLFLNSGDELVDGSLQTAFDHMRDDGDADLWCYQQIFRDPVSGDEYLRDHYGAHDPSLRVPFWHQAVLFRTDFHKKFFYDIRYSISGDHDLFLRMLAGHAKVKCSNSVLSVMYSGGLHQQRKDHAALESLSSLIANGLVTTKEDLHACSYFLRLASIREPQASHLSIAYRLSDSIKRISKGHTLHGIIYGNSLIGRQIYAISPTTFSGFIDRDIEKACLPGVRVFPSDCPPSGIDFILCSLNLSAADREALREAFFRVTPHIYFLSDLYEF